MQREQLKPNAVLRGPIFPVPVQVIVAVPLGDAVKVVAKGLTTGQVHVPILNAEQLARLETSPDKEPFDVDLHKFRLGVAGLQLALTRKHEGNLAVHTMQSQLLHAEGFVS